MIELSLMAPLEETVRLLALAGIGHLSRVAGSSLRGDSTPCISHATEPGGTRTLCGRDASNWTADDAWAGGPDCILCDRVWKRRLEAAVLPPVVLVRTIYVNDRHTMVYAERVSGGRPNATRIQDGYSPRGVLLAKQLVLAEARERWGKPERVRFEEVDRRSRRQWRRASTRVDAERSGG